MLKNVSMVNNVATNAGGAINNSSPDDVRVSNSLIVGNEAIFGSVCGFVMHSDGHNLFDDLTDCTITGETTSNIIEQDFFLYSLQENNQLTLSHTPDINSAAIDNGSCDLSADQRGVARPQGNGCDIGAVEFEASDEIDQPPPPAPDLSYIFLPMVQR
ncbi:MAG: choice-of-anchor Q domain-containing protein [Chloroflexota bacterium]